MVGRNLTTCSHGPGRRLARALVRLRPAAGRRRRRALGDRHPAGRLARGGVPLRRQQPPLPAAHERAVDRQARCSRRPTPTSTPSTATRSSSTPARPPETANSDYEGRHPGLAAGRRARADHHRPTRAGLRRARAQRGADLHRQRAPDVARGGVRPAGRDLRRRPRAAPAGHRGHPARRRGRRPALAGGRSRPSGSHLAFSDRVPEGRQDGAAARPRPPRSSAAPRRRELLRDVASWQFSPDGRQIFFLRGFNYGAEGRPTGTLAVADFPSGANPRELQPRVGRFQVHGDAGGPARAIGLYQDVSRLFRPLQHAGRPGPARPRSRPSAPSVEDAVVSPDLRHSLLFGGRRERRSRHLRGPQRRQRPLPGRRPPRPRRLRPHLPVARRRCCSGPRTPPTTRC